MNHVAPNSAASRDIAFHLHQQTNPSLHEQRGPTIIASGDGCHVVDENGNRLLEAMSALWCTSLGFSESRLIAAAAKQMATLPYYMNFRGASSFPVIDLAEKLVEKAPGNLTKVMFQCSGSEANDTAVKLIWRYFNAVGKPSKKKIISRHGGYHGTGIATGSISGLSVMHDAFDLPLNRFLKTTNPHFYRNAEADETEEQFARRCASDLEALIMAEGADTVAAFFAEPVMASGGVIVPPKGYFAAIQSVLRRHDILFVVDEVICGFGRTGKYWGSETYDLTPDIMTCAKALTSGYFPMSATLVSADIYDGLKAGISEGSMLAHGYTYGAHPVGAAVAVETMRVYDEMRLVEHVAPRAERFLHRLRQLGGHPLIGEARGVGLCGAIELVADKATRQPFPPHHAAAMHLVSLLRDQGVIVRPIGEAIAFAPPLVISEEEIEFLFDQVEIGLERLGPLLGSKQ